ADNLDLVDAGALGESLGLLLRIVLRLEKNRVCINQNPKCEPQLGRRGLYRTMGGLKDSPEREMAMLWVLNFSDGSHSLLDIAERSSLDFAVLEQAAVALEEHNLLRPAG
ncbi:MAG TPA: winged helix-turn-helix domain-containing protein, partial [Verrucomicrobiae bacterium]|nr:winged helix-turn-helix domain-containing protein [Verrucomicrobiae bacterium]